MEAHVSSKNTWTELPCIVKADALADAHCRLNLLQVRKMLRQLVSSKNTWTELPCIVKADAHCRLNLRRMLRQLVSGAGCVDDTGPSGRANPLQSLFTDALDRSKHHEYLPEVRFRDANVAELNKEKIRSRSHIHLRHVFPGLRQC